MAKLTDYPRQTEVIFMPDGTTRERNKIWLRSDQEKPTEGVAYPDMILETDTANLYYFNDNTKQWDRQ